MDNETFLKRVMERRFGKMSLDPDVRMELEEQTREDFSNIRRRCSSDAEAQSEYLRTRGISLEGPMLV